MVTDSIMTVDMEVGMKSIVVMEGKMNMATGMMIDIAVVEIVTPEILKIGMEEMDTRMMITVKGAEVLITKMDQEVEILTEIEPLRMMVILHRGAAEPELMIIRRMRGPSGFSSRSTAEEFTHGVDGTGLTAIVTGASSGIGFETARVLALHGVHVVMEVRNSGYGAKVKEDIANHVPGAKVDVMELDLNSMESVRKSVRMIVGHFVIIYLILVIVVWIFQIEQCHCSPLFVKIKSGNQWAASNSGIFSDL